MNDIAASMFKYRSHSFKASPPDRCKMKITKYFQTMNEMVVSNNKLHEVLGDNIFQGTLKPKLAILFFFPCAVVLVCLSESPSSGEYIFLKLVNIVNH